MTWNTTLSFVLFTNILVSICVWLTTTEILPLRQDLQSSDAERNF